MTAWTCSRFLTVSFTTVGKPAPPRPTMPLARTASRKSCIVSSFGGWSVGSGSCLPSAAMTTVCMSFPPEPTCWPIFLTVPETLAYTGADTKPPALPISWPTLTLSPGLTTGMAGAPMCMDIGISTVSGMGRRSAASSAVFLRFGTCTPWMCSLIRLLPPLASCLPAAARPCPAAAEAAACKARSEHRQELQPAVRPAGNTIQRASAQ